MMTYGNCRRILLAGAALTLAACGGGGGSGINSTPTPTPSPTPTPTPTPTPPPPPPEGPLGLKSNSPFTVFSSHLTAGGSPVSGPGGVKFAYSAADDRYTVTLPGFDEGHVVLIGANGSYDSTGWTHVSSTFDGVTVGNTSALQAVNLTLDWPTGSGFTYTSIGRWSDPQSNTSGYFAYGIPTAAGDVPVTGSAGYTGEIRGLTGENFDVFGSIALQFNFGAGTLSGEMKPEIAPVWDTIPLGTYTFRDTVFSAGSNSFSGSFNAPGTSGASAFQGSFNGPKAAEAMGSWNAPYLNPLTNTAGSMAGIFIARKGP
jgi:hypothetical protein